MAPGDRAGYWPPRWRNTRLLGPNPPNRTCILGAGHRSGCRLLQVFPCALGIVPLPRRGRHSTPLGLGLLSPLPLGRGFLVWTGQNWLASLPAEDLRGRPALLKDLAGQVIDEHSDAVHLICVGASWRTMSQHGLVHPE